MDTNVRRGLGVLCVAVIAYVVGAALYVSANSAVGPAYYAGGLMALAGAIAGLVGLGLVAWGLLRPRTTR